MQCFIEKASVIALFNNEPVYTILLQDIVIDHKTEYYILKLDIKIMKLSVIDTSIHCGNHPIIFETTEVTTGKYIQYDS